MFKTCVVTCNVVSSTKVQRELAEASFSSQPPCQYALSQVTRGSRPVPTHERRERERERERERVMCCDLVNACDRSKTCRGTGCKDQVISQKTDLCLPQLHTLCLSRSPKLKTHLNRFLVQLGQTPTQKTKTQRPGSRRPPAQPGVTRSGASGD